MPGYMPDPIVSARRNLTERIEAFEKTLKREPSPFEERNIELAKGCLLLGQYRQGEEYVHRAERSDMFGPKDLRGS